MEWVRSLHNQFFRHFRPKYMLGNRSYLQATNWALTKTHIKCQVSVMIISLNISSPVWESLDAIYCKSLRLLMILGLQKQLQRAEPLFTMQKW